MKYIKRVWGHNIEIELVKIRDHIGYSLYQIYKLEKGKKIPLYKECYTDLQLAEIQRVSYLKKEGYICLPYVAILIQNVS